MERMMRTDLASEWSEEILQNGGLDGLATHYREIDGAIGVLEVCVESDAAAKALQKPRGKYLTVFCGKPWEDDKERFQKKALGLAGEIRNVLPRTPGCVLLAGLGNRAITADAVGPETIRYTLVTRHLKRSDPELFAALGLRECAAIAPGVLGQTGMESADVIRSVTHSLHPDLVILIDALAARRLDRLATTIQISDTGISPGSGVGNRRECLDEASLGVPVCSIGVPTVVDAATLAYDVLEHEKRPPFSQIRDSLCANGLNFFVTPKETDELLKHLSRLIGYGINLALHPGLSYEEMASLAE